MPFVEGSSNRVTKGEDNLWHCIHCDYSHEVYQSVVGHLNVHYAGERKRAGTVGRPRKIRDPLDMSFTDLANEIEVLRKANADLKVKLIKEQQRNSTFRAAMTAFMTNHGAE